jgi:HD-like signal output (HDOD) protein
MAKTDIAADKTDQGSVRGQILARIEKLPSLSLVVNEFLELSKRAYFTARDFERVIVKDQALVARLLKVANSGMFGSGRQINTIPEAVVLVGMENMKNMVYAVSSGGLLRQELQCYRYPDQGFWLHAMGVGITCRAVSEISQQDNLQGEQAFVAGLLHDVGKLIIDDFLDPAAGLRQVTVAEEREVCGLDHPELADQIMERWNIPENIVEAVFYHHNPQAEGDWRGGAALVHLADAICNTWKIGLQPLMDLGEEIDAEQYGDVLAALGTTGEDLRKALLPTRQKLARLEDYFVE